MVNLARGVVQFQGINLQDIDDEYMEETDDPYPRSPFNQQYAPLFVLTMDVEERERLARDVAMDVKRNAQDALHDFKINFTKNLRNSLHVTKRDMQPGSMLLYSDADYAHHVEFGAPPRVRIKKRKLFDWVHGKLGIPKFGNTRTILVERKDGKGFKKKKIKKHRAKEVTEKIYWHIKKNGTRPTYFLRAAILRLRMEGNNVEDR